MTATLSPYESNHLVSDNFKSIYIGSFPEDERRHWHDMERMLAKPGSKFRPMVITTPSTNDSNEPHSTVAGIMTTWWFSDMVYVEHFAIHPNHRGCGLGCQALGQLMASTRLPLVIEVEPAHTGPMARQRISFYRRLGFRTINDFTYIQPAYGKGKNSVELTLMARGAINPEQVAATLHSEVYGCKAC